MRSISKALFAVLALLAWSPALAGFTTFSDRASFEAALDGAALGEDFSSVSQVVDFGLSSVSVGDLTLTGGGSTQAELRLCAEGGNFPCQSGAPVSGLVASFGLDVGEFFTVDLGGSFTAFGFEFFNSDSNGDAMTVRVGGDDVLALPQQSRASGFFGFTSTTAFSALSFVNANAAGDVRNAFDDFTWGTAALTVPAPGGVALAGLLLLGCLRRRGAASI